MSPFNWLLYLDVADNLISSDSEACLRSAVSRAYYGVSSEIRSKLESSGIRFRRDNIHRGVIQWLRNQPQASKMSIGLELDRLRLERNRADYNAMETFTQPRAEKALLEARQIVSGIGNLP